jgi:hypothetical protein
MQFAIYDLLGALFALSDLTPNSSHTDKLFTRVCRIARTTSPIPTFPFTTRPAKQEFHCAISRSFSRRAEQRTAGSFRRFAWITRRVF